MRAGSVVSRSKIPHGHDDRNRPTSSASSDQAEHGWYRIAALERLAPPRGHLHQTLTRAWPEPDDGPVRYLPRPLPRHGRPRHGRAQRERRGFSSLADRDDLAPQPAADDDRGDAPAAHVLPACSRLVPETAAYPDVSFRVPCPPCSALPFTRQATGTARLLSLRVVAGTDTTRETISSGVLSRAGSGHPCLRSSMPCPRRAPTWSQAGFTPPGADRRRRRRTDSRPGMESSRLPTATTNGEHVHRCSTYDRRGHNPGTLPSSSCGRPRLPPALACRAVRARRLQERGRHVRISRWMMRASG